MRVDIFCRVVDNYGDIGVCWRLARRLAGGLGWQARLWVDDLRAFARIEPRLDPALARQRVAAIDVVAWRAGATPDLAPGDVVIEAFACDPPPSLVARMAACDPQPVWINLEYLSAETWAEACHALPSPQPGGLVKHFFFPGFTPASGGLLREPGLLAARDALQADPAARARFLAACGLPPLAAGERLVTLFCYPHAPAETLVDTLAGPGMPPALLAVPAGVAPALPDGRHGTLRVARLPFLPQDDYDRLLWCADLNAVRGEDSFVRAHWAGRPLLWHIYPQDEDAHLVKLAAWLERTDAPAALRRLHEAWNAAVPAATLAGTLRELLAGSAWTGWQAHAASLCARLAGTPDLADRLAAFCADRAAPRRL